MMVMAQWEVSVKTVKLSRSSDGSFGISIEGGSDKGQFCYVGSVRDTVIVAQGHVSPGDMIIQVNGDAVGGFIHWDLLCEIRRSGSLLSLVLVPENSGLPLSLREFLSLDCDEDTEDSKLQKVVRHNVYSKTVPCTTRLPRVDETPGADYQFLTDQEFTDMDRSGLLLEQSVNGGYRYGTPKPDPYDPSMMTSGRQGKQLGPRQLGKLPPGWEVAYTQSGQKYFINHNDGSTTWADPRLVALQFHSAKTSKHGSLPYGWEEVQSEQGAYYIDHLNKRTTTQHPNTLLQQQQQQQQPYPNSDPSMLSGYGSPIQVPGNIVTAVLYKTTKGFGFTLSGGDRTGQPVLIKSVKSGSAAETQGGLRAGDVLVRVNGQVVGSMFHSEVVNIFKSIPNGGECRLELRREGPYSPPQGPPHGPHHPHQHPHQQHPHHQQQQQYSYPPPQINGHHPTMQMGVHPESISSRSTGSMNSPNGAPDTIPVYIDKGENGFGFTIHQSGQGQRIKSIMDKVRCSHLLEGDLIMQINSDVVHNRSHAETVHILKSIPPFTRTLLLIQRPSSHPSPPHGQDQTGGRKDKKNRSFRAGRNAPPPHQVMVQPPPPPQQPHYPPTTRVPLTMQDSNRISDHGSVLSGSDRQPRATMWDPIHPAPHPSQSPLSWESQDYDDIQVDLQRDNNGFGFRVIGGEEQGIPVAVGHVMADGPAEGSLQVYDEIRSVNGQSVLGCYHTKVLELIGNAASLQGRITLIVRRHRNPELLFNMTALNMMLPEHDLSRYKLVNMRNVVVTKGPGECFGFVISSSLRADDTFKISEIVPDSPAGRCDDLLRGDSVLAVDGTPITGLQHKAVVELIKKCDTSVTLGVGTPQLVDEQEEAMIPSNQTEELEIVLQRDDRGFGFSVRGGHVYNEKDTLFVLRIAKGGAADRDGRLRRGDEIVMINGECMAAVPHQDAVDKLKTGGDELVMVVRRKKVLLPPLIQQGLAERPEGAPLQFPQRTDLSGPKSEEDSKRDSPSVDDCTDSPPPPPPPPPTSHPEYDTYDPPPLLPEEEGAEERPVRDEGE